MRAPSATRETRAPPVDVVSIHVRTRVGAAERSVGACAGAAAAATDGDGATAAASAAACALTSASSVARPFFADFALTLVAWVPRSSVCIAGTTRAATTREKMSASSAAKFSKAAAAE